MKAGIPAPPPKLAAPGAGLPKPELFFARLVFRRFRKKQTRESITELFIAERDRILPLAGNCNPDDASRQILIKRLPGLEDSSRNWSVFMTLEHLRIVNQAVSGTIRSLAAGKVPPGTASTAAVKPKPGIGPEVVETFSAGCNEFLETVAGVANLNTPGTYPHPWFGPLNAAAWHAMAAFHMRLHRAQVEKLSKAIGRG